VLINGLAEQTRHLYHHDVEKIVDAILGEIIAALTRGDRVELRGFGTFSVKRRSARIGRTPRTGVTISVEKKTVPYFKSDKEMRERMTRDEAEVPVLDDAILILPGLVW
jgi:integration host factor subunit beta